uniref:Complement regulatory plasma protein n=1 Tax=Paralabrax nebulifer TaxID=30873 RepID=Q91275_9TELE|nr:complement regulatory plasma protein [Paralabrax nebulifer]
MDVIARSCVLFLWLQTLTSVKSQVPCTLQQFIDGEHYDSNFDTTGMEASYPGGRQVRVGCNVGYSGFFKLVCVEGKWETRGAKCQPRSCGHPGDAQFADFHLAEGNDFVFGSKVVYTCQKGYQMVSRINYRRCVAEGWDGVVPVCESQQCPLIHVDNNVQVIGGPEEATFGNVVRFSCKSRSEILDGSPELYCDERGDWSGPVPKCKAITCAIPPIENGNVPGAIREYKENDVLHYECDRAFKHIDRPSTCIKQGIKAEWSPTPLCESIKCRLTIMDGTRYEPAYRNLFSPGETLKVICARTSWISTPQETSVVTTCQDNGEWSIRPTCQEVRCSNRRPEHVDSWDVRSWERYTLDDNTRYWCKRGYKRTGGVTWATCGRNGWMPNPLCEVKTCSKENIQDAVIVGTDKQIYNLNQKAIYACGEGNRGRITLTCGENGWSGDRKCTVKPCPLPPKDPNGFFRGPYTGRVLYYTCKDGYKLFTEGWWAEAKCVDGVWPELTTCISNTTCGKFPEIPNAEVIRRYPEVQTVQVICNQGYSTQANSFSCENGNWLLYGLSPDQICTLRADVCGPPPEAENAVVKTSYQREYLSGSEVTYLCRDKYIPLEGVDTIRCRNGQWDKEIKCTSSCDKLVDVTMDFTADKEIYIEGQTIRYQCLIDGAEGIATCNNTKWVKSPQCKVKPCELPADIPNGQYDIIEGEELVFGTKIKYVCNEGYQMISKEATRTCMLDGWSNHVPTCEPLSCEPPPTDGGVTVIGLPDNGNPILPDRFLDFSCDGSGRYLNGSARLICGKDGQWDKPFPSCEDITCEIGVMPTHVSVVGLPPGTKTIKAGQKLQLQCDNAQPVDRPAEIECLQTGEWNAAFPACGGDTCTLTAVPDNVRMTPRAALKNQMRKGQKLKFACTDRRDTLLGKAEVECLDNGKWSYPFPTCGDPLDCGNPPSLDDGDVTTRRQSVYRHGASVEYRCQALYTMEGGPRKTCDNGEWTGSIRCIKPCTVDTDIMRRHNIEFRYSHEAKLYATHDDVIEFRCTSGRHVGSVQMRQKCLDGVMNFPTCQ